VLLVSTIPPGIFGLKLIQLHIGNGGLCLNPDGTSISFLNTKPFLSSSSQELKQRMGRSSTPVSPLVAHTSPLSEPHKSILAQELLTQKVLASKSFTAVVDSATTSPYQSTRRRRSPITSKTISLPILRTFTMRLAQ